MPFRAPQTMLALTPGLCRNLWLVLNITQKHFPSTKHKVVLKKPVSAVMARFLVWNTIRAWRNFQNYKCLDGQDFYATNSSES